MIVFRDAVKRFGAHTAVDRLSVPIGAGEVVALLGPNGSGKTTTLKMAAGLIRPDEGEVGIGEPPRSPSTPAARRLLSFLPQRVAFPDALTGREVLEFHAALRGAAAARVDAVLRLVSLEAAADRFVSAYSGGMLQRLGLAAAALPQPSALLLDEPTAALDPDGLCAFYGLVERGRAEGKTVLFSSHQVGDVERLADRFLVLVRGRLVAEMTQAALRDRLAQRGVVRLRLSHSPPGLLERVRALSPGARWIGDELVVPAPASARLAVLEAVTATGAEIRGLAAHDGQLDALYRELVGRTEWVTDESPPDRPQNPRAARREGMER
jgi:Cu-processing system ATP-binding protein